jgi:hypothetical protein
MAGLLVRNEEATGSIPVSSTIVPITYRPRPTQSCHTLSHKIERRCSPNTRQKELKDMGAIQYGRR